MEYWQPLGVRDYNPVGVQEWEFDWSAIEEVIDEFEISHLYVIEAAVIRFAGYYETIFTGEKGFHHRIGISHNTKAEAASRILWHEMTHMRQAEELGPQKHRRQYMKEFFAADIAFFRAHGYFRNEEEALAYQQISFEREAYEASTLRHDDLPLTRMRA